MNNSGNATIPFGLHLMLDMYNCSPESLNDKDLVLHILQTLPEQLGLKIILGPYVTFANPNGKKDPGGWSGVVVIQESHITIHTFIKRRFVSIDAYSCREFDTEAVLSYFEKIFKTNDVDVAVETRGKRYPAEDLD